MSQNAHGSGSATPHTRLFSQPAAKVDVMESFCFVLSPFKQQRKKINKTRDDRQGSTHVLSFRRTCCYGNAGCAGSPGGETPSMRGHRRPAATPPRRLAAEDACVLSGQGPGPPNSPHVDRLSQEHFLLPHEGRVGAPQAVFAAVLREVSGR